MLELRKFDPDDMDTLKTAAIDDHMFGNQGYLKAWAEYNGKAGPAYTGLKDGKIVGAAGVRLYEKNTGELWAVFSKEIAKHKKELLRSARELLGIILTEFNLRTLVATSKKDLPTSQRLLEHLGFVKTDNETSTHFIYTLEV